MASISQVVARRTQISPDEAFLTGLLHGIGRLYIMVRGDSPMKCPQPSATRPRLSDIENASARS